MKRHYWKQTHQLVTEEFLGQRVERAAQKGYPVPQWIRFCRAMMKDGSSVYLYEAQKTYSKYVTVCRSAAELSPELSLFKVRFSDHKPIERRELEGDCDFFVGHTNFGITTTAQAVAAARRYFAATNSQVSERWR